METYKLYDGKVTLNYDPGKHKYFIGDVPADGVTSALGIIDKSGPLLYWAVNKMCLPYLKNCIKPGIAYDEIQLMNFWTEAGRQHTAKKEEAAGIGTLVHAVIEAHIKHKLEIPGYENPPEMPVSPVMQNAYGAFLEWEKEHEVKYLYSEKKICHPKWGYAGTLDFEAVIDGELCIGDLKTSNGLYDEFRLQTAAYLEARKAETHQNYKARWCVRVGKETKKDKNGNEMVEFEAKKYPKEDQKPDFQAFTAALTLYRRIKELKKNNGYAKD